MDRIDLGTKRYGRLTSIRPLERRGGHWVWLFRCDCGTLCEKPASAVKNGNTLSCGCLAIETMKQRFRKHGHTVDGVMTGAYRSWRAAKNRCNDRKGHSYHRYGGRGVTMCDAWRNDFSVFLADMGERPEGMTLDRFPNRDGNYEPANCRWATMREQAFNKTHRTVGAGSLADYARRHGVCYSSLWWRIKSGQDPDTAVAAMKKRLQRKASRGSTGKIAA